MTRASMRRKWRLNVQKTRCALVCTMVGMPMKARMPTQPTLLRTVTRLGYWLKERTGLQQTDTYALAEDISRLARVAPISAHASDAYQCRRSPRLHLFKDTFQTRSFITAFPSTVPKCACRIDRLRHTLAGDPWPAVVEQALHGRFWSPSFCFSVSFRLPYQLSSKTPSFSLHLESCR